MNLKYETVEQYLDEVSRYLDQLPDKDQILRELRAHIWDQANKLHEQKGLSIQLAFEQAVELMEEPHDLAAQFLEEEGIESKQDWRSPLKTPEAKVQNEQFIFIAIIGFISVFALSILLQLISNNLIVSGIAVIIGILAISMFIFGLKLNDEKLFKEQLAVFRERFQKPVDTKNTHGTAQFIRLEPETTKEVSFWSAFGEHLGGFLGGVFTGLLIAFIFFLDVTKIVPIFNENWYPIGALAVYIGLGIDLLFSIFLTAFGRIRVTRLLSAGKNIIGGICGIVLLIFYPFTAELALISMGFNVITDPDLLVLMGSIDNIVLLIIGFVTVIQFISALYDVFKFGAWKPVDRKSLI